MNNSLIYHYTGHSRNGEYSPNGGHSPYDLNQRAINYNTGYQSGYSSQSGSSPIHNPYNNSKLPMSLKRGYKIIKPLNDDDLIRLFLEMINIAATETIYSFENIKQHKEFIGLFEHKPFKVKQVAEYVLQTFDDNLSRQQFQYLENEEADYGLIYTFDGESDSESDVDLDRDSRPDQAGLCMKYANSSNTENTNTSRLQLELDNISEDDVSRENLPTTKLEHAAESQPNWFLNSSTRTSETRGRSAAAIIPAMSITESSRTKSTKSVVSTDESHRSNTYSYNNGKRRRSKLIRIMPIKRPKSNDSTRSVRIGRRASSNESTPVNAHNVSYKLLLKDHHQPDPLKINVHPYPSLIAIKVILIHPLVLKKMIMRIYLNLQRIYSV